MSGRWEIRTETGSRYYLRQDEESRWWFSADNVPTEDSRSLVDGEWEIVEPAPWPPVLHQRLWIESIHFRDPGHPLRVPGGGKYTSHLVEVVNLRDEEVHGLV